MASRAHRYVNAVGVELVACLVLLTASAWVFGSLAEEVVEGDTHVDIRLADWLHEHATPGWTDFFEFVTAFGNLPVLLAVTIVAAVLLAWTHETLELRLLVLAAVGAEILTVGLKLGFHRERPVYADPLATERTYSFPSGHATISLAVYGTLAFIVARHLSNRAAQVAVLAGAAVLVLLIGFSRLYLGVHFLTDVIAGFSLGIAWVTLCLLLLHIGVRLGPRRQTSL